MINLVVAHPPPRFASIYLSINTYNLLCFLGGLFWPPSSVLTRTLVETPRSLLVPPPTERRVGGKDDNNNNENEDEPMRCDGAFLSCLGNDKCSACFDEINDFEIDWASVASTTPCEEVVAFLKEEKICVNLAGDAKATTAFCQTFHTCAFWTNEKNDQSDDDESEENGDDFFFLDCSSLRECDWDGIHPSWVGDGICHEDYPGCYNSAACGWDGGDCCKDTCKTQANSYVECGHEGFACRDPASTECDPELSIFCRNPKKPNPDRPDDSNKNPDSCKDGTTPYRLVMYDSFGDGWDETTLTMATSKASDADVVFAGGLAYGSQGYTYICLQKGPCYHVEVAGGTWGKEVSWDVRGFSEGSRTIASGGAPMSCDFSVGNDETCPNTCLGRTTDDPTNDPGYKEYKDLYECISKKCLIQVAACDRDLACKQCLQDTIDESCFSVPSFVAVTDCTLCQCTERKGTPYCMDKVNPGGKPSDGERKPSNEPCSPGEIIEGGKAVMTFSKCTDFDSVSMMVTVFEQKNFGDLDEFQSCAHAFHNKEDGWTALECLQLLVDAKDGKRADEQSGEVDKEVVSHLAKVIYESGESFCDCAKKASNDCPLCPSFMHFKTLLYESLDACKALDEIDCDAWEEFYKPCKKNLEEEFESVNFSKKKQCDFVKEGCGGAGPFPAFRRLDCGDEIPKVAWDFHNDYAKACEGRGSDDTPTPPVDPKPTPPVGPSPTPPAPVKPPVPSPVPVPKPSEPTNGDGGYKPYVPTEESKKKKKKKEYDPEDNTDKSTHWIRNFVLVALVGGVSYYLYNRRQAGFRFNSLHSYRAMRNFGDDDMYSGLAMESSTSFEPPSLPPPPSALGGSQYDFGGNGGGSSQYFTGAAPPSNMQGSGQYAF